MLNHLSLTKGACYRRFSSTHNIKQLGFSGLRVFVPRFNFFLGGYERAPKTQPFHIVNRCRQAKRASYINLTLL
jgi:hypothetical protein